MRPKTPLLFLSLILVSGFSTDEKYSVPNFDGEIMHYNVKYGIFNIGKATISFTEDSLGRGKQIKAVAQTTGIVRMIKSINYRFECCMDTNTGLPIYAIMDLTDRRYRAYNYTVFDHHSREDSSIVLSNISGMHIVPKNIFDILTAYFCFRENYISLSVETRQDIVFKVFIADELWALKIRYVGKETIKTKYGKTECLKYIPSTIAGNFFKNEDDMTVWFTDDATQIPVRIRLDLIVGSINGNLVKYQEPQ